MFDVHLCSELTVDNSVCMCLLSLAQATCTNNHPLKRVDLNKGPIEVFKHQEQKRDNSHGGKTRTFRGASQQQVRKGHALQDLCNALARYEHVFSFADYVEGGLLTPGGTDVANYDFVRKCTHAFVALLQRKVDFLTRGKVTKHVHSWLWAQSRFSSLDLRVRITNALKDHLTITSLQKTYKAVDTSGILREVEADRFHLSEMLKKTERLIELCTVTGSHE